MAKKPKTIVLADFRWLSYRSAFRFNEFQVELEEDVTIPTGSMYGVLEFTKTVLDNYENVKIYYCLDGNPVERLALLPSYKEKRHEADPKPEIVAVRQYHDEPIKILSNVPEVTFIQDPEREADDLMSMIALREKGKGNDPIIFTGDKDLLQMMQFDIKIAKNIEDGKLLILNQNYITAHKDLGVAPDELLYLRALDGDKSDEIPAALGGNKELKKELAVKWAQSKDKYLEHFDQLLESMEPTIQEMFKGKKAQQNNRDRLKTIKEDAVRNIKLMDLEKYSPIMEAYKAYKETQNKDLIDKVKEEFKFNNIKTVEYDLDDSDVRELLDKYDLQRHKAWMNYNNYI
jgi:5'-3' exonuclease